VRCNVRNNVRHVTLDVRTQDVPEAGRKKKTVVARSMYLLVRIVRPVFLRQHRQNLLAVVRHSCCADDLPLIVSYKPSIVAIRLTPSHAVMSRPDHLDTQHSKRARLSTVLDDVDKEVEVCFCVQRCVRSCLVPVLTNGASTKKKKKLLGVRKCFPCDLLEVGHDTVRKAENNKSQNKSSC
jgi:hypothetical protein